MPGGSLNCPYLILMTLPLLRQYCLHAQLLESLCCLACERICIDLCRAYVGMAQLLLDKPEVVSAATVKHGRVRVPGTVDGVTGWQSRLYHCPLECLLHCPCGHVPPSMAGDKKRRFRTARFAGLVFPLQVFGQMSPQGTIEMDVPFPAAFSHANVKKRQGPGVMNVPALQL